jgi:hypothetical protein
MPFGVSVCSLVVRILPDEHPNIRAEFFEVTFWTIKFPWRLFCI